jgi:hypothetical protein
MTIQPPPTLHRKPTRGHSIFSSQAQGDLA